MGLTANEWTLLLGGKLDPGDLMTSWYTEQLSWSEFLEKAKVTNLRDGLSVFDLLQPPADLALANLEMTRVVCGKWKEKACCKAELEIPAAFEWLLWFIPCPDCGSVSWIKHEHFYEEDPYDKERRLHLGLSIAEYYD